MFDAAFIFIGSVFIGSSAFVLFKIQCKVQTGRSCFRQEELCREYY